MFSNKVVDSLSKSSMIRAMFEEGEALRKLHGPDKVFDFSIGNPEINPPQGVKDSLKRLVLDSKPGMHRYMSNAGFPDVRQKVAQFVQKEQKVPVSFENIVMTCGAAGGLNIVLKTLLNPGDQVIVSPPYFVEYKGYIENYGGITVEVPTNPRNFQIDADRLEKAITPLTKAVIINSPNNPTGVIYDESTLRKVAQVLEAKEKEFNTTIFVISDEPYTKVIYDGAVLPAIMSIFKNSIIVNSFSKSLALPGERIGYIAVNSAIHNVELLIEGLIFCNRVLGYVNAPALMQQVVADNLEQTIDVEWYKTRRDILYNHLISLGFSCIKPQGAFYLFPKALIDDDVEFKNRALKYNLLIVPGSGFGMPGYFRLAYCISLETIKNSLPAFEALAKEFKSK